MKIVVFGLEKRLGVWAEDVIVDLAVASDGKLPSDLLHFIEGGDAMLAVAASVVKDAKPGGKGVHSFASVELHAPHVPGARIACAGGNFADHTAAMAAKRTDMPKFATMDLKTIGEEIRSHGIWGFWKVGRDATPPGGEIIYPTRTQRFDYEGEVAIVLGKTAKNVKSGDLRPYVWGITLFGDWSIRDLNEGSAILKYAAQKNFDGSYSIGPCIVAGENLSEDDIEIETWVNGERRQQFNTRDMVFKFGEYLEYLSTDFTFYPGDMIAGGTAAGTAADSSEITNGVFEPGRFLKHGDHVEIRSVAIGTLSAHIL